MNAKGKILIIDDNEDVLFALNLLLDPYVEKIKVTTQPTRIEHFMTTFQPDVILLDMNFRRDAISGQEGFDCLEQILKLDPQAIVLFMTAYADTDKAVRAIKAGAIDFIPKPWEKEKLLATLSSAIKLRDSRKEVRQLKEQVVALSAQDEEMPQMIGHSAPMREVFDTIRKLSDTDANILILGENGTGKDLVARSLRYFSPRRECPFITIDLGSIPESLFESELFGYEKGAFTDARKAKAGRMEVASGGTLFLDEIANLPYHLQAKLLTAIQKRCFVKVGSNTQQPTNIRLICATNRNLEDMVRNGEFREDLLYRINTIHLHIPALRERKEDILPLAKRFLEQYARQYGRQVQAFSPEAARRLLEHPWYGNIRELQHTVEKAVILSDSDELRGDMLQLTSTASGPEPVAGNAETEVPFHTLDEMERSMVKRAIDQCEGNLSQAAAMLGITRQTLYNKMKRYGL